jgi:hypothetical protein
MSFFDRWRERDGDDRAEERRDAYTTGERDGEEPFTGPPMGGRTDHERGWRYPPTQTVQPAGEPDILIIETVGARNPSRPEVFGEYVAAIGDSAVDLEDWR